MPFGAYIGYLSDESKDVRKEVREGDPFVVEVRDLDTFERRVVRAVVAEPGALDEEDEEAARADITDADRTAAADESRKFGGRKYRGSEVPDAMGQEEARKFFEHAQNKGPKEVKGNGCA